MKISLNTISLLLVTFFVAKHSIGTNIYPPVLEPENLHCKPSPTFRVGSSNVDGTVTVDSQRAYFGSLGYIYMDVCKPGVLSMLVEGVQAASESPLMQLSVNGKILMSQKVNLKKRVSVNVPTLGRVAIVFVNPLYLSSIRATVIKDIFISGCEILKVGMASSNSGQWSPDQNQLVIYSGEVVTLNPCRAGKIRFSINGDYADGSFPIVTIKQNRIIERIQTSERFRRMEIDIQQSPIYFNIINPYAKLFGHRQIYIEELRFK